MIRHFLASLLLSSLSLSQGTSAGFGAMELPLSARNAALGEASVADRSNHLTTLVNPALLAATSGPAISISHQRWIQDVRSNFLFFSLPVSFLSAGLIVSTTTVNGIELREIPGPPTGTFDAHTATIGASVAAHVEPELAIGATIRHVYEKIYVDEATSVLFDIGAQYRTPVEGLTAGISLQHFGIVDRFRTERSTLPTQTNFGLSYQTGLDDFLILGVLSGSTRSVGTSFRVHGGAECIYSRVAAIRIGYQTGFRSRGFSGGLGFMSGSLSLDYGYLPFSLGLGTGHLLTLGYQF